MSDLEREFRELEQAFEEFKYQAAKGLGIDKLVKWLAKLIEGENK